MTSTLLVLLLLSQAEAPDDPPNGAMGPLLLASPTGRWRYLTRLEVTTLALLPRAGMGTVQLFNRNLDVAVKGLAIGMGRPGARYLGGAELRWRILGGRLYALGTGGTLLFPESVGTLRPGAFVSLGLGVDNAR